jgi:hypothetical protein
MWLTSGCAACGRVGCQKRNKRLVSAECCRWHAGAYVNRFARQSGRKDAVDRRIVGNLL